LNVLTSQAKKVMFKQFMVVRTAFLLEVKLRETQVVGLLMFGGRPSAQAFALNAPYGQKA